MTWVDGEPFRSGFYFGEVPSGQVNVHFEFESSEPVRLHRLTVHQHPDVTYRKFENGLVLANPAPRERTVDLSEIWPGESFRFIQGSSKQDPERNDGTSVPRELTMRPEEGLFLVRE